MNRKRGIVSSRGKIRRNRERKAVDRERQREKLGEIVNERRRIVSSRGKN
ncbi:hypothetical protein [Alkalihalobacterium chitinilyticum]|uniref:Uncharacterized protein n=1 Tax=Alkalihalobacterium chitinilyticum TaxID=2980103 RepID=A0ABT5VB32_9BACI|nr:hypothetical protein [Alkalihalobacterium chitinilyticum]MDE5412658.1 hypothetical protein [Alkalihalobacterium chitinilyticum]